MHANLFEFSRWSGWQGFVATKISEKRKNILRFSSSPLEGTTKSQPSRIYQRPKHGRKTKTVVRQSLAQKKDVILQKKNTMSYPEATRLYIHSSHQKALSVNWNLLISTHDKQRSPKTFNIRGTDSSSYKASMSIKRILLYADLFKEKQKKHSCFQNGMHTFKLT